MTPEVCARLTELGVEHGFAAAARAPVGALWTCRQVHGVALVRAPDLPPDVEADALWTDRPGVAVGVRTADCVPVLLFDPIRTCAAAIHAGWRGIAAGIAGRCVARLALQTGLEPAKLCVAVGPHIGPCCYEVDAPVRRAIDVPAAFERASRPDHWMLDLAACVSTQLGGAGVDPANIHRVGGCTACDPRGYPSYRRDGGSDRMLHWLRMPA